MKVLRLLIAVFILVAIFASCDNYSLKYILDGVPVTVVNKSSTDYTYDAVGIEETGGTLILSGETKEITVFYGDNQVYFYSIPAGNDFLMETYVEEPITWVLLD